MEESIQLPACQLRNENFPEKSANINLSWQVALIINGYALKDKYTVYFQNEAT